MGYTLHSALIFAAIGMGLPSGAGTLLAQESSPVRIVESMDEGRLVTLKGNTPPKAKPAYDRGPVAPYLQMGDLVLVLRRSPEGQAAFNAYVASQYEPGSPRYHSWLTPEQVGEEFGPSSPDLDVICNWLIGYGFTIDEISKDRLTIRFSGTAAQVEEAFHTGIHKLFVPTMGVAADGEPENHIANMSDPQIPAALAPLVVGIKALHDFFPHPLHRLGSQVYMDRASGSRQRVGGPPVLPSKTPGVDAITGVVPQFATVDGYGNLIEDVVPYDFATIYDVLPLWKAATAIDGTGQTIAIAGTSNINLADVAAFRAAFGLPVKAPSVLITNSDPGDCPSFNSWCAGDLIENTLDVEWSGAVAKGANITLVTSSAPTPTSDALYLSESYIVQHKTAPVMNVSYGECELVLGNAGNTLYNNLWETAASEGIAVFVAAGDAGSPACDQGFDAVDGVPYAAQFGLQVSGIASTAYDTAVGGTDFNWGTTASPYWSSTDTAGTQASALGYIPEVPWNSTCTNPLILPQIEADAGYIGVAGVINAEAACNFVVESGQYIDSNYGVNLAGLVDTIGTGGGASNCTVSNGTSPESCAGGWPKPSWQSGVPGILNDGHRDIPDVSFFASNGFLGSSYLICVSGGGSSCSYSGTSEPIAQEVGGTSVASPAMAGVMALINQKSASAQGNPNTLLYTLAAEQPWSNCSSQTVKASSSCIFNDINTGTNAMPCVSGSLYCTTIYAGDPLGTLSGFNAGAGYDAATGLGSVNIANVVNSWPTSTASPVANLSATMLTFAATTVGVAAATQPITLKNTGKSTLALNGTGEGISITGANAGSFSQSNNCGTGVASGSQCTITVTFKPASAGALSASVHIADNAFGSPQSVALTGSGVAAAPAVQLSANLLTFNSTVVGSTNTAPAINLTNTGTATLNISSISITGTGAASFSQTQTCGSTLAVKASCGITIAFKPKAAGTFAASLSVADNAAGSPQTVGLSGTGAAAAAMKTARLKFPVAAVGATTPVPGSAPSESRAQLAQNYGRLPLRFEANQGQADPAVRFSARGAGYAVFLTDREAVLALRSSSKSPHADVVRMQLGGARPALAPAGIEQLSGASNYFIGNDSSLWRSAVPAYAKVRFSGVYDGVDLVYYGNQQQLEYDFVVAPHADPRPIQLHFAGATSQHLDAAGNLAIVASGGEVVFHKPVIYQLENGRRRAIPGAFKLLADNSVGFRVSRYDHAQALIIDPTLVYSTYLGGSNSDMMNAIAVDGAGEAFVTGSTASADYPVTVGAFQTKFSTAFVTKLNATGTAILYSTFLGGSGSSSGGDIGRAIAVDSAGEAFVTGSTYSSNFPVTKGAYQASNRAAATSQSTTFVTKLNSTGTALIYSTYLGGTQTDTGYSLAIDSAGDAYIGGAAFSGNFPVTAGVLQSTNNSLASDGWNQFVTKLNPAGTALLYSTYLGGSGDYSSPTTVSLAIDSSGDAFIASTVLSTDFPVTTGVFQKKNNSTGRGNMTLAKLNPTATKLIYATYLGGSSSPYGDDTPYGLAVDPSGNAYLSGTTWETNYPVTTGAYQTTNKTGGNGPAAAFVTKVNPAGTALVFSTYLSGSGGISGDRGRALALDSSGDVFVTGSADSTDFPVTSGAYQSTNLAGNNNGAVVFLTKLNPAGSALLYSTYFGGSQSFGDTGNGIALGAGGTVYVAGVTGAGDFPITKGAYETGFNSRNFTTGFVSEFTFGTVAVTTPTVTTLSSNANPAATGSNVTFTAAVTPTTGTGVPAGNVVFSIDLTAVATVPLNSTGFAAYTTQTPLALGTHNILASYAGNSTYGASGGNLTESITPANPVIAPAAGIHPAAILVTLSDSTASSVLYYTTDGSTPTASSTKYTAPLLVSTDARINAIAIVAGKPASNVIGASYIIVSSPYALAVPATAITASGATLNALVNSYGMAGSYSFAYGLSPTALTSATTKTALPSDDLGGHIGIAPIPVSTALTGLSAKTAYYYQVVASTAAGTSAGEVLSFTTN